MSIKELKIQRNIIEAREYCQIVDSELSYYKTAIFKNEFEKKYIEEYYPLYLYFIEKYKHFNYSFLLLLDNSKQDGLIYNENNNIHERIQVTCASIDEKNSVRQHEMLLKQGIAPGSGEFKKINDHIVASRILRTEKTAIFEVSNHIVAAILKKESKGYNNIDTLLILYHFRFKDVIGNWNLLIIEKIKEIITTKNIIVTFPNIYLVEENGTVNKFI